MTDSTPRATPRLRPVELLPIKHEGEPMLCLRDPTGIAEGPVLFALHPVVLGILQLLDGEHSVADIHAEITTQSEEPVPSDLIEGFVGDLERHGYLEGPAFEARREAATRSYLDAPERPSALVGGDPEEALDQFRQQWKHDVEHPLGPGTTELALEPASVRGILAPHIDYLRGGYAYAWAYRALAQAAPARTYVILGTIHRPMDAPFAATRKPFRTPLGLARVDTEFLDALRERYPEPDLLGDEFAHANEHSIELQVLYLQHVLRLRGDDWRIVPILVDSFEADIRGKQSPARRDEVRSFVEALRRTLAEWPEPVCLIGGVDFAHVGPRFGAEKRLTDEELGAVARADRAMLDTIEAVDPEGFLATFCEDDNERQVCSVAPIYCLLSALDGTARGTTLRYGQAVERNGGGAVTFAGVVFTENQKPAS